MSVAPMEVEEADTDQVVVPDKPWVTIVWNDPVNLMSYVAKPISCWPAPLWPQ